MGKTSRTHTTKSGLNRLNVRHHQDGLTQSENQRADKVREEDRVQEFLRTISETILQASRQRSMAFSNKSERSRIAMALTGSIEPE